VSDPSQKPEGLSYQAIGLLLASLSALSAAMSHAFLKAGEDKLSVRVWSSIICAVLALPVALWAGNLPLNLWLLLCGFALLSFINQLTLVISYELSDFSHAYPVARGIVPLAMAVLGVTYLGDTLTWSAMLGILAITMGIVSLALGRGMSRHGWGAAAFTGLTTIIYNLIAAQGMRAAEDVIAFLAWLFVTDGILLPAYMAMRFKGKAAPRLRLAWPMGWQSGLLTLVSFATWSYAVRLAPVGMVSAIRESSVLIALVLAAFMLKERMDRWRIMAGLLIVAGAAAIILGSE
jgi:drug/metabolite transporter (DMT)-like permease